MWRRWAVVPALLLLVSAPSLGGCVEILDLGRFRVGDGDGDGDASVEDGGFEARDAGEDAGTDAGFDGGADGGSDACVPTTYYADRDGDGHGDPMSAMSACTAPDGYVTDGDDCDDGDPEIHPGASERCDGLDQDCDGAIDEGLIGPLGNWNEVVSDLGDSGSYTEVVTHRDGYTVAWYTEAERILRASFFDRDATAIESNAFIQGYGTTARAMARFSKDGLDQIVFATVRPDAIEALLCSTSGQCASTRVLVSGDTTEFEELALEQLRDRMVARWVSPEGQHLLSFDPRAGTRSAVLTIPPIEGMTTRFAGFATVDGPEPQSIIGRYGAILDGVTVLQSEAKLVRVHGEEELRFEPATDILPWDASSRCAAAGIESCLETARPLGRSSRELQGMAVLEVLSGADADGEIVVVPCLFPVAPVADAIEVTGPCLEVPGRSHISIEGPLFNAVYDAGVGYAFRQEPLSANVEGSSSVALPETTTSTAIHGLSMDGGRGAVLARTRQTESNDLSFMRLGCEP